MIQTNVLNCPSCGAELLDPIYDLEMVDGGRRRLTCGECGRPFTVEASLVYDVTADGEPAASPLADAALAAFRLTDGGALRGRARVCRDCAATLGAFLIDENRPKERCRDAERNIAAMLERMRRDPDADPEEYARAIYHCITDID